VSGVTAVSSLFVSNNQSDPQFSRITCRNTVDIMDVSNMASPLTLRLDAKTRKRIERIARRRQVSVSEVIRLAIAAWAEQQEPIAAPYEAIADLIGVVHGGIPDRSTRMRPRFSEVLKKRRNSK
jgi:Ribbon-helix-helix protein, copG family